ncbi:ABC transporter substrate-binding protein [Actinomadura craniellae]|uniref:ABC transporter substrate-binding protein n=1 Tax=Actinomadura craniellae TaxID=2231787 RepID=A0A365GW41_9ACTN|nr:MCE family protein [Actinomadura craniellae]RAY11031.1 ABC transporter substrate-binding protein [Actinomadura craniellae]
MNEGVFRRRAAGVVFLLLPVLLIWLSVAMYDKRFTEISKVTLHTASVGNEMHLHADVKLRGVVVGEVRKISASGSGATLELAIQPEKVRLLPANVSAQMLPTTLFGQRYVALIPPDQPSPQRLVAGSVIRQDRSTNAIEIQQVLDNLLPMLNAVQPAKLAATLTALSQAVDGRGTKIGTTLVELDAYLKKVNPNLPQFNRTVRELAEVSHHYSAAAPDILQALNDLTYTSRTLAEQQANLSRLYSSVTGGSQRLSDFLRENSGNIIRLSSSSRPNLRLLAKYSPEYPCVLEMLADFVPVMDKVLGKGTREPGLHVQVRSVPARGKYVPGRDRPAYGKGGGPHCYPVPYRGGAGPASVRVAPANAATPVAVSPGGLGLPNSPQENGLVNELLAPGLQEVPEALPDWSTVLVGPIYRGTEVRIK